MNITHKVHSVEPGPVPIQASIDGVDTWVTADGVTVELTSSAFTHTYRFTAPDDVAEAMTWAAGDTVVLSVASHTPAPTE